ncbi:composite domain of metallo-dependent hydrolase [Suillus subaureus]|uniref:Composite domain of metallo-dependent hydrolase n=1 Tax=Suillus subaureus TaxID=48587 RepID=A0A9P7J8A3_9AGAM|nr:composite domain of metallo-dependent hydrolase [Suillus subaureus]KAG1808290.1 composite domain of metallo-dependent hydrolase [Suillus subaureus]
MDKLPTYSESPPVDFPRLARWKLKHRMAPIALTLCLISGASLLLSLSQLALLGKQSVQLPLHAEQILQRCNMLHVKPGPPSDFHQRTESDRFVEGTHATLIRNASIWTGDQEITQGDILLDKGIIKFVGHANPGMFNKLKDLVTLDAGGSWVTPGIVDLHSHLGVDSAPALSGASDGNSLKGPILPWLRSLDGLNTHDDAYRLSISGGVTTANVLPGSANAIGGQAFVIKLRPTAERSPSSMLLEPPYTLNGTHVDPTLPPRWRQMKHACGENPSRVYGNTRMDTFWAFRQAYDTARQIKEQQDAYCARALAGEWENLGEFPDNLQWEALVDVLRGRVKAVDLDDFVRLTNEFQFPIAAFHHAHETYLVPGTLKQAYGHTPAAALFATNARYKREAYRGSEFAPRILAENGIDVVMKSDHPVLNSRFLLYEAQQAYMYGLPANLALAAVTSTPARIMGQDHRIGFVREGYDADLVVWDSHPLALGTTPQQVWIDGTPQLSEPAVASKPASFQQAPRTPNFDLEAAAAIKYDGLPPLTPKKAKDLVVFANISSMFVPDGMGGVMSVAEVGEGSVVALRKGVVQCWGAAATCANEFTSEDAEWIDLEGGSIAPGLISYGSPLGLEEIQGESSTHDGTVFDPLTGSIPSILAGSELIKASDGLQFAGRDTLSHLRQSLAYRAGVTTGVTAPSSGGLIVGLSTAFSTGAAHKLEDGAVIQDVAALHVQIGHSKRGPSVSTQIAALRNMLLGDKGSTTFAEVTKGAIPLVVEVQNADIIASLIELKKEIHTHTGLISSSLFQELGEAGVGVVLTPSRPFPDDWESKRILPGPPLTNESAVTTLLAHGVTVGVGVVEQWSARNTRFDVAWAALESFDRISREQALALASVNLEKLLGVKPSGGLSDMVATRGGTVLDSEAKVIGIISARRGVVDLI